MLASVSAMHVAPTRGAQGPRVFTNLQVLPEDITTVALFENMKRVTKALGVECRLCHRSDIRDFATDEIETKRVAREMMLMTIRLNNELSAAGTDEASKITCFTCHQGQRVPTGVAPTGATDP